jgi:hypothetical protein
LVDDEAVLGRVDRRVVEIVFGLGHRRLGLGDVCVDPVDVHVEGELRLAEIGGRDRDRGGIGLDLGVPLVDVFLPGAALRG